MNYIQTREKSGRDQPNEQVIQEGMGASDEEADRDETDPEVEANKLDDEDTDSGNGAGNNAGDSKTEWRPRARSRDERNKWLKEVIAIADAFSTIPGWKL